MIREDNEPYSTSFYVIGTFPGTLSNIFLYKSSNNPVTQVQMTELELRDIQRFAQSHTESY